MKENRKARESKILVIAAMLLAGLCLMACGGKGNTLMADADVETGALHLWKYDGETATGGYLFDLGQRRDVLDQLAKVSVKEVEDWSPSQLKAPMYGIEIMGKHGDFISALWSENLWITEDGKAYRFACDMGELLETYEWQPGSTYEGWTYMTCGHALTHMDGAWDATWMVPAQEVVAEEGHEIRLVEWTQDNVTVTLINNSEEEWILGEYYHLEVQLDGIWYLVPSAPGKMWMVHDLAYMLPSGGSMDMAYSLWCYGDLPVGRYRLVAEAFEEGLAVGQELQ